MTCALERKLAILRRHLFGRSVDFTAVDMQLEVCMDFCAPKHGGSLGIFSLVGILVFGILIGVPLFREATTLAWWVIEVLSDAHGSGPGI